MLPSFDGGEHAFGIGGPDEGSWIGVCFRNEAVDGRLEVGDGAEHAALEASSRELGEEAFNGIEPRRGSRREVERPAGMLLQPFADLGVFVGSIVVNDGMDRLALGHASLDHIEMLLNEYNYLSKLIGEKKLNQEFATDLGVGNFRNVLVKALPFIRLRQKLSPQYASHFVARYS